MTVLELTRVLKSNRKGMLWINDERRVAAYHPCTAECGGCTAIDYNVAKVAKTDPAFGVISDVDGATYAAI